MNIKDTKGFLKLIERMKGNKKTEAEDSLQELIDILWDYVSEKDIPEITERLEEKREGGIV